MKIKSKLIALATTAVLSAIAINVKIFKNAEKTLSPSKNEDDITEHIYNWKFGKISYKTMGKGSPILLVHSLIPGTNEKEWQKNIFELAENNKLYLINLLGYGDSERADITYSSYLYVCLINDFITDIIKEPAVVIASNTSASISAMSYVFNPNNFKKICLVCPPISPKKTGLYNALKKLPLDLPILGDLFFNYFNSKKVLKSFLKENIYSDTAFITDEKINNLYAYSHKGGGTNRYLFTSFITNSFEIGIETSLPEIDIPVLIVYGDSLIDSYKNIETIKTLNPSVTVKLLKGKSLPNEEDFEEFNKLCLSFINYDV